MSTSVCIAYYGLRFEVELGEIDGLESRLDPRIVSATRAGLKHFWSNFASPGERYLLFVGTELAALGAENALERVIPSEMLHMLMETTKAKLHAAGLAGNPSLYLQWAPDA